MWTKGEKRALLLFCSTSTKISCAPKLKCMLRSSLNKNWNACVLLQTSLHHYHVHWGKHDIFVCHWKVINLFIFTVQSDIFTIFANSSRFPSDVTLSLILDTVHAQSAVACVLSTFLKQSAPQTRGKHSKRRWQHAWWLCSRP